MYLCSMHGYRLMLTLIYLVFSSALNAQSGFYIPPSIVLDFDSTLVNQKHELMLEQRGVDVIGEVISTDIKFPEDFKMTPPLFSLKTNYFQFDAIVQISEAKNLSLVFSELNLKEGYTVSITPIYDEELSNYSSESIYIFNGERLNPCGLGEIDISGKEEYITPVFNSNRVLITLLIPRQHSFINLNEAGAPFTISEVRVINSDSNDSRGDGECNVDINCSEGNDWSEQRDAVVKLIINEGGTLVGCTGTLMNNTSGDKRGLILSALHCMTDVTAAEFSTAVVIFNNENSLCNAEDAAETHMLTGLIKLADSNDDVDGEANPNGSDFILLELEDEIPTEWNPYWAGWYAADVSSTNGVCIHHPGSEAKKISTYTTGTSSTTLGALDSHWGVNWEATENGHGVTEPGSSGSPLFNSNGFVVGTLTGGFSACEESGNQGPEESDYFGKLSYHWQNNPNEPNEKLKLFLDPLNLGQLSLAGSYSPIVNIAESERNKTSFLIYPSVFINDVFLELDASVNWKEISIYDNSGRIVLRKTVEDFKFYLPLDFLSAGTYTVKLVNSDRSEFFNRITKL